MGYALEIETIQKCEPLLYPSRYKGLHGGRGSSKSWFFAELMIEEHLKRKIDCVCLRETLISLKFSVKKLLEDTIERLGVGSHFTVQDQQILSDRGGRIIFQGMQSHNADSIKSLENFEIAWFAEAQKASQRSLDLLRPTIRAEGSELWFDWNPENPTDPIDVLLRGDNVPPDAIIVELNYNDNPWFPEVLREEMEYDRKRDFDKYSHIWLGQYKKMSEARVFKNWQVKEFERPEGTIFRLGADWGFSIDPSVMVRCSIEGKNLYIDREAYMVGCDIIDLPELFDRVPGSREWFCRADSARPETISHMQQNGYPKMQACQKGAGSINEGISFLQGFDIVVHPRCVNTIEELKKYSYKVDRLTEEVLPILDDKNNHVIDALRYAVEGVRLGDRKVTRVRPKTKPRQTAGWMA